jgi:hypothetical protein
MSLNSVNQLIVVMETVCVFFEVRADFLNIIKRSFGFRRLICFKVVGKDHRIVSTFTYRVVPLFHS